MSYLWAFIFFWISFFSTFYYYMGESSIAEVFKSFFEDLYITCLNQDRPDVPTSLPQNAGRLAHRQAGLVPSAPTKCAAVALAVQTAQHPSQLRTSYERISSLVQDESGPKILFGVNTNDGNSASSQRAGSWVSLLKRTVSFNSQKALQVVLFLYVIYYQQLPSFPDHQTLLFCHTLSTVQLIQGCG